jgi:hypothetical protein
MKKANINNARILKARFESEVFRLVNKRRETAVIKILPGENIEDYIDVSTDDLTEQINNYIDIIFQLNSKIMEANSRKTVHFEDKVYTISESLFLVQRMHAETNEILKLSKYKKRSHDEVNLNLINVTAYNPEVYAKLAAQQQIRNEALSSAIDEANSNTFIEYDDKVIHL